MEVIEPELIQRACGGWLAVSPRSANIRVGVTADTEEGVRREFSATVERWRLLLVEAHTVEPHEIGAFEMTPERRAIIDAARKVPFARD